MGFFSWKCAVSKKSIPHDYNHDIHLVTPNGNIVSGRYNGYGSISGVSIMDAVADELDIPKCEFGRRGIVYPKTGKEYLLWRDFQGYEDIIPDIDNKLTVNKLLQKRLVKELESNDSRTMKNVKIVVDHYFDLYKHTFENLPVSESCEYQGYFYPKNFKDFAYDYH